MEKGPGVAHLLYCCDSCHGLFRTIEDLQQHAGKCSSDISKTECEFVAINKDWYMKYILPHVKPASEVSGHLTSANSSNVGSHEHCYSQGVEISITDGQVQEMANRPEVSEVESSKPVMKEFGTPLKQQNAKTGSVTDLSTKNSKHLVKVPITEVAKPVHKEVLEGSPPRKKLRTNTSTEYVADHVTEAEKDENRSYRTRRKAVVDYRRLNDGVEESQTSKRDKKNNPRNNSSISLSQNGNKICDIVRENNCQENNIRTDIHTKKVVEGHDNSSVNVQGEKTDSTQGELSHEETYGMCKKYVKMENGNRVMYQCPLCTKKTPFIGFFRRHMETFHNDGKGFICEICNEKCLNTTLYRLHKNRHVKPFVCEECSVSFAQKKDLQIHSKLHSGEYSYFCEYCDYKCRQMKSLKEHLRLHDGNVLQCSYEGCEYQTIYAFALRSHILSRHTEKTLHQCQQCKFKTNDRGCFNRHMKIHLGIKNYKCGMCEYKGRTKHDVVRHMSVHTGEKRYQCPACAYSTSHGSALRSHLLKHMGIRAWQCGACTFVGSQKQHVLRHVQKKHPDHEAEDLVRKSNIQVKVDLSEFKTWENDSYSATNEELLQLETAVNEEDLEAVTHIIFQDPDNPDGDRIMTIATEDLEDDQNVTIMTIDAGSIECNDENDGQVMTLATDNEDVMIITEGVPAEVHDVIIDNHIEVHSDNLSDSVIYSTENLESNEVVQTVVETECGAS